MAFGHSRAIASIGGEIMSFVRRNVWTLPVGDETLLWYSKAIGKLKARPFDDPTSWLSLAAMHGLDEEVWRKFGYIAAGTTVPNGPQQRALWNQCQHLTWFFLPWHRGYLSAFEQIVRNAVVELGGPANWALPYWNYSADARSLELPKAFAQAKWPDGSQNHLHVPQRYGSAQIPNVQTPLVLDPRVVTVAGTLAERFFEGSASGGSAGFGGVKTAFWHGDEGDSTFGVLERQPHGPVHVWVGGGFKGTGLSSDKFELGLMTNPDTAALDPIFWLHHANIDRLWKVWLRQKRRPNDDADVFADPTDPDWLNGPQDRQFAMPDVDGTIYNFQPRDVLDTKAPSLDYIYDDDAQEPEAIDQVAVRFERLGASPQVAVQLAGAVKVAPPKSPSLIGANSTTVRLNDDVVESKVKLDTGERQKLSRTLSVTHGIAREPDRVYLNLENVTSPSDAAIFYVYVNLPENIDPAQDTEHLAGTFSMFGVSKASNAAASSGNGVTASFDITRIIDATYAATGLEDEISVKLVAAVPGATSDAISIGRISIYRQEQ